MNCRKLIGSILLLLASVCVQAQGTFVIEGKVSNVKEGVCLRLFRMEGDIGKDIAADTLRGGTFRFEQQTLGEGTDKLVLIITEGNLYTMALDLWARPGSHIKITGDDMLVYTWQVESDIPQQHIRQLFVDDSRELWNEYQQNDIQEKRLYDRCRSKDITDEMKKDLRAQGEKLSELNKGIQTRIDAKIIKRMKQLPVDDVWMGELEKLSIDVKYNPDYPYRREVTELYNSLSEEQRKTDKALDILSYLAPPDAANLGEKAADDDLFDLQGNVHHLSDFKGKPVLIDFWSRGCGPCIMALPEMKEISKKYEGRLVVVSLSIDNKTNWEIASRHHEITWWNLNDLKGNHGLYAKYDSGAIPRYVFLSSEGEVQEMWSGYGKGSLLEKLEKLMKD
ncbi:TlpA family protein disulfide reductase [Bacteroides zoogleoformans]|uniref:TlpA family protein disulfide reductase n=1 Tax=Bacteroides zoogleoformans TaxID=28119 RepID=UPI00248F19D2|nr:TlpA disulfide reductase family protein [Bacteroides zoogleoformans]